MDEMDDLLQSFTENTIKEETETLIENKVNEQLQFDQQVNIKTPKIRNIACIDVKNLEHIEKLCQSVRKEKLPLVDLFLGVSTLLLGASLSALISQIPYELSVVSVFSYTVCPMGAIGFFLAYWYSKKKNSTDIKDFAEKIHEYIEDEREEELNED